MRIDKFSYTGARTDQSTGSGPLADYFWQNEQRVVHKWHHYFPIYERHFAPFRGTAVKMLEIGVSKGGSLDMWRNYFGPDAVIFGVDIDETCAAFDGISGQVRIGSQADPDFLRAVVAEMGGVDIVLDDGSHRNAHINASLDVLFPILTDGGVYLVEDTHACYWKGYGGGYRIQQSFLERAKAMVDDLHHWYHDQGENDAATKSHLAGMHIYDSVVVFDKAMALAPRHTEVGKK
jgi:hypothetical protein